MIAACASQAHLYNIEVTDQFFFLTFMALI
jgi:hypothetical protein